MPGLLLHSFLGACKLREVVVEGGVVTVGEVVLGEVGFNQWCVVHRYLHDIQDVEPIPVLVLGYSEKLLDGAIHSLGLSVGLSVEGT